ncbi:MAG: NAD(+) diphosphatase [Rhodospirillales bacterium]
MPKRLMYTGGPLDRAGERRRDAAWLAELLNRPEAKIVPVWRDRSLVESGDGDARQAPRAGWLMGDAAITITQHASVQVFLGIWDDTPYFAVDLSHHEEEHLPGLVNGATFEDLRQVGRLLADDEATILAYARGMLHWHRRQKFCSDCGSPTEPRDGGHVQACLNADCGRSHFPRTDPAVIMLVTHTGADGVDRCLLGWSTRWDFPMYSTLAGFVEPGESLEEAVAREVLEESGIRVEDVTYRGSQPWPFPASLMLGFRARGLNDDINVDPTEIREAKWFSRADLKDFGEFYGETDPNRPRLPRTDSISRRLINDWLEEGD